MILQKHQNHQLYNTALHPRRPTVYDVYEHPCLNFWSLILFMATSWCRSRCTAPHKEAHNGKGKGHSAKGQGGPRGSGQLKDLLTFGTTRVVGPQPYAPAAFTQREIPGTQFQKLSRPQGTWFRREPRKKSPETPPGIDSGTSRLEAQCLNHYVTPGPKEEHNMTINQ